jgi:hypothetical protein
LVDAREKESWEMYDILFVILTVLFAAVSISYVFGCERL